MTVSLVYQSFGVVYGDLSTSPIYVFTKTFSGRLKLHESDDDIDLGVLSLVFWTLTIIPLCKYIIFVLGADDNGGTFALYPLLCRHFKLSLLKQIYSSSIVTSAKETQTSLLLKDLFQKQHSSRIVLFLVVLLGTSMVIGDGVLTPTMSGAVAIFADLGHFSQLSIRIAFTGVVYPSLVIAYMGEAEYLWKIKVDFHRSFHKAIPGSIRLILHLCLHSMTNI